MYLCGVEYKRSCICVLGVEYERSSGYIYVYQGVYERLCICVLGVEYERSYIRVLGVECNRLYLCVGVEYVMYMCARGRV